MTIPEYESPKGQSPASMRYLMHMGYDNECFAAGGPEPRGEGAPADRAGLRHSRLRQDIHAVEKTRRRRRQTAYPTDEQQLLADMFAGGDTLDAEAGKSPAREQGAARSIRESLKEQFKSSFFKINGGWHVLGIG